ncbi:coiled-coil domain-containing protein 88B isoform X1 [Artibeus jamaicensis]|uniref:coiled-coil domain-containing protein 88B isoform X1 n=1 Tax=Artibeus jamaicensis TaxID=9417 RepID=UPI00235AC548|nr:coiled-coil domain-containing protein 88B isoform X1 [Artibeus jamaicensis]
MDGARGPRLRDFLSGSLATWALGLAGLAGEAEETEGEEEEEGEGPPCPEKRFLHLSDGALLLRVLDIIAPSSRGAPRMIRGPDDPPARRVRNLSHLWGRLRDFYQEELRLLILSPPPDLQTLGFDPFSEEAVEELEGTLRLLLGASVQCEHRELFIRHIQGLSLEVQSELAAAIQEVTQPGAGVVLALAGPEPGELASPELEMLSRNLMGTLLRLARERDVGAQRLAELLLERQPTPLLPEAPAGTPLQGPSNHLALQLANTKAQLRRLRQELEEKAELLLDSQEEVHGLEADIRRLRQEAQTLSGQAKRAELYREEVEALRERASRLPRLQEELRRCRERLQVAEACKGQLEEERALSGTLEASKALLEEQLEAAQERCARLHETQRENLLLRTRLGEAHAELDSLRHQVDQLAEENVELELELQRSLEPPPGSPGEAPLPGAAPSIHEEVKEAEAGRLRTLERENQELRALLQVLQGQPGGQRPLLEEQSQGEASQVPELAVTHQTCLASDHGPQGLVGPGGDADPQTLDLASLASDSAPTGLAECPQTSDPDTQVTERPFRTAATAPQTSDVTAQESGPAAETQEALERSDLGAPLQTSASAAPPQGPESKMQAQLMLGGGTGESVPETQGLRQGVPECAPEPAEPRLQVQLEEPESSGQQLDLPRGQTEAREQDQRLEGMTGSLAQKTERAPDAQTLERPIPGEILTCGDPEQEALREEVARLRREAEALRAELEVQARRLEARGTEAARLSEELAQARRAEAEAHREAEAQAQEQARLREAVEAAGRELEAASREREALAEALVAAGRERRQWEREAPRLRARAEAAEERLQMLEGESRQHLEEAERERRERQALGQDLEKAVVRGQELGARLERLQNELEQATLERQEFLREQELQHQRYEGLEQRLKTELQAVATSKEEALMELKKRALQLEEELFQLRQGPMGQGPEEHSELRVMEAQSGRLVEVERSNATLVAEKAALQGQLQLLEGQLGSLQGRAQELLLQSQRAQEHSSRLQAEKSVLEMQGQELHRKLGVLEEEVRVARQSQEETRRQQQSLLQDHESLAQLQRRQEAELEGLLARHRDLKANMRALELAHRELQGRHEQLQAQRANVEAQELALLAERERLMQDGHRQRGLEEELRRLQSEHDRAQKLLAEVSRERGELQGERGELRSRLARLELERAQLEMQSQRLRESNQQLDLSACRLTTQCELLTELRSAQEEENRQLLAEVQALSRENRELLERSLESRDHLHREQREYLDQLNALRREKQKLVEKIMDQYRVLEPGPLPRTKKGSWLADKVKRLMRPRREGGPHGGPRLWADGAGSTENLGGPPEPELSEGREADGTAVPGPSERQGALVRGHSFQSADEETEARGGAAPCPRSQRSPSPAPMRRAQSSLCLRDETLAGVQRRKLSSRFPVGRSSESFSPGDTPRQRFRRRPLGPLSSPGKGPGVRWNGSVETLAEHEADAGGEGERGLTVQEPEKKPLAPSLSQ